MADRSAIEWTEATWNPTTGCDRISSGCDHWYALTLAKRLKAMGNPKYQLDGDPRTSGPGFGVQIHEDVLGLPYRWAAPRVVFVNSMSDLFHARVTDDFIRRVFEVMETTPRHTYQLLTKRPRRVARLTSKLPWPTNVWMGVSIEDDTETRLTNLQGTPLYDMIFATDHEVGDKIMSDVYRAAAARFPRMRQEIRARRRDQSEAALGSEGFWSHAELVQDALLRLVRRTSGYPHHRPTDQQAADQESWVGITQVQPSRIERRPAVGLVGIAELRVPADRSAPPTFRATPATTCPERRAMPVVPTVPRDTRAARPHAVASQAALGLRVLGATGRPV